METLVPYIKSISDQLLSRPNRGDKPCFEDDFNDAVNLWSKYLLGSNDPTEINQLVKSNDLYDFWKEIYNSQNNPIVPLVYIYSPGQILYRLISCLLGGRDMDIKIIVILAFLAVSTNYIVWQLQQSKQRVEEQKKQSSSNSQGQNLQASSTILQTPQNISTPKKYSLILAISASKEAILPALYNAVITQKNYKELYQATQSLRILETDQIRLQDQTSQFYVTEASEYDVYLVKLDLRQKDDRFGPDQDQMDRYDAFQNLPNLVTSMQISSRLTMDVCTSFNLYVR